MIEAIRLLQQEEQFLDSDGLEFTSQIRDEYKDIISEFLEEIFYLARIRELENKVSASKKMDIETIKQVVAQLKKLNPKPYTLQFDGDNSREVNPVELINELEESLSGIDGNESKLSTMDIMFRLEMVCDRVFTELMGCFKGEEETFELVFNRVREKLNQLSNNDMLLLWSMLKSQFGEDRIRGGFIEYDEVLPQGFLETNGIEKIKDCYSWFIVKYKPLTILKMIENGIYGSPAGLPGVARVLSMNSDKGIPRVSSLEVSTIRLVSRLVALYEKLTWTKKENLAKSISVDEDSLIFGGHYYDEFKKDLDNKVSDPKKILLPIMERLLKYAEELNVSFTDVSQALWQYKLGQEVIAPLQLKEVKSKKETDLQKELSKFLVERNILSFGRTFGRSEIDLYTKHQLGEDYVIEVKVYKTGNPSVSKIQDNIVQLQSYMDQVDQPKGILLIYNCTDNLIVAPRHWFNGRLWVLALNIGQVPPSGRKRTIELVPSGDIEKPIVFSETGRVSKKKATKKTGNKKTKKKTTKKKVTKKKVTKKKR
ncbi:MAG: hypothetical protein CMK92_06245 [Pseudomonas sp.]|nr:hypothetical protein [Pseudomonas sp.]